MVRREDRYTALPWSNEPGDRLRFGVILAVLAMLFAGPAVLIPGIELPEPERQESEQLPPQLARLLEAKPPEPVAVQPEPVREEPIPKPEPEPPKPERDQPQRQPVPVTEVAVRQPPQSSQTLEQAREVASNSGLLALQDQLAALRQPQPRVAGRLAANISDPNGEIAPQERVGEVSEPLAGSGGVADQNGPTRAVELAGHEVRKVEVAEPAPRQVAAVPNRDPGPSQRAMSNIRQVFDAQKTALYSLYRRELRQDPTLEGKVLLELIIEPDGRVSHCEVVSSELGNPELESRLANRVRLFNFGADNVAPRTVRFPIDFLPS